MHLLSLDAVVRAESGSEIASNAMSGLQATNSWQELAPNATPETDGTAMPTMRASIATTREFLAPGAS
jgi:hypothetical protein